MTTNILATLVITLVTNVLHTDNSADQPQFEWEQHGMKLYQNPVRTRPTERYELTEVYERAMLSYEIAGQRYNHIAYEKPLSSVTRILRLKEQWEDVGTRTNDWQTLVWTNLAIRGNATIWTNPPVRYWTNLNRFVPQ